MRSIITNGLIITMDSKDQIIKNGSIIFEGDKIQYVGPKPDELTNIDQIIDAKGHIVMPGLINTHGHGTMALLRGYGDDLPLQEWLETKMWPIEGKFTKEHIHWGTKLALIEMLKSGTTTFADMYIHMDVVGEAVKEAGIRASLTRGILALGSEEKNMKKLEEAKKFAENWKHEADGRITTMMSPHSLYTCSPEYVQKIAESAKEIKVPIHIHLSETALEVNRHFEKYGLRPVEHLDHLGILKQPLLVAHAVHINDEELKLLKEYDVKISHNPGSNLKLGSGIAPVPEMLELGITVSLGTDSAASNNNLDMFEEMRLAALIHKGAKMNSTVIPAKTALKMATVYGAESLFISKETGSIEVGKKADFIVLNTDQPHFHPLYDPVSHLVYSASGKDVSTVFINGRKIVENGHMLTLDEERILYEVELLVKKWS